MSRHDDDARLSTALAELPRGGASPGFTRRVLARLDESGCRAPRRGPRLALAGAAAAALAALVWAALPPRPDPAAARLAAEADEIRRQHRLLEQELAELRALGEETAPVLYLGADDDFDLVLDLRPLLADESLARPASYRPAAADDGRR